MTRLTARWPATRPGATWEDRLKLQLDDDTPAAWVSLVGSLPWTLMLTLTFDPNKRFPVSRETASRETCEWLDILSWTYRGAPTWLYSVERGRSGLWHTHPLVTHISVLNDEDVHVLFSLVGLWEKRNGSARVSPVSGTESATLYVTKGTPYWSEVVLAPNIDKFKSLLGQGRQGVRVADGPCRCSSDLQ